MRVLVSLLTDKVDDINLARRKVAYHRIVLVVHPGAEELADRVVEAESGDVVDAVSIETPRVEDAVEDLRGILAELEPESEVTLNAAGGHAGLVAAMILVAYEEGLRTLFIQEGHVEQLPILEGLRLEDRLSKEETAALDQVGARRPLDELEERTGWARRKVEKVCRGLEEKGLGRMELGDGSAMLVVTKAGEWVRAHMTEERP